MSSAARSYVAPAITAHYVKCDSKMYIWRKGEQQQQQQEFGLFIIIISALGAMAGGECNIVPTKI